MDELYADVTDTSDVLTVNVSNSHSGTNATATVVALNTGLDINSPISIDLGYTDDHGSVFSGYVKNIESGASPNQCTITAGDVLVRASEYFIVSNNPDVPLEYSNTSPEDIIEDLLALAGITDFSCPTPSSYIWGVAGPIKISLVSAYDYSKFLADLIAWQIYADENGHVYFEDRRPYPMDSDSPIATLTDINSIAFKSSKTDKDLKNKVVVWGTTGVYAHAENAESYDPINDETRQILPDGFFKSAVVSSTIIDNQDMAQQACDFNLLLYNRLTGGISVSSIGSHIYKARNTITVNSSKLSISSKDYYIYSCEHQWSQAGYTTNMDLRK